MVSPYEVFPVVWHWQYALRAANAFVSGVASIDLVKATAIAISNGKVLPIA